MVRRPPRSTRTATLFPYTTRFRALDHTPGVVVVTAHTDYAAQAFDINAVDYLLKPVSPDRLAQTLSRLRPRATGYLATRTKSGTRLLKVRDLTIIQAEGDYVRLNRDRKSTRLNSSH